MLRGQSTLSRLVGKRRRPDTHPLALSDSNDCLEGAGAHSLQILPDAVAAFSTVNKVDEAFGLSAEKVAAQNLFLGLSGSHVEKENLPLNWVQCPVCQKDIQGDNGFVHIHVDLCLLERSNCKSTNPREPLKFKRLSLKHAKQQPSNAASPVNSIEIPLCAAEVIENETIGGRAASAEVEANKGSFYSPAYCDCNCACHNQEGMPMLDENMISTKPCSQSNEAESGVDSSQNICKTADVEHLAEDDRTSEVHVLETYVVGRRFNRHVKVEENMEIQVLREPENPKDGNAIKIVGPSSQGSLTIGHLQRDLASCLTHLLDKEQVRIKGFISRVPLKAFEPVPVTLFCEKIQGKGSKMMESFEETWQRVLDFAKPVVPKKAAVKHRSIKILDNFTYLLKVVLERDSHLFSEEELVFLGSFLSLTVDSQSLFVRLSQRKGPWFRVSRINYLEISDVEQACHQLAASGFFSVGDTLENKEGSENAFRERLHVLSVPELKQILSRCNFKQKKQDAGTAKRDDLLDWVVLAAKEKHQNVCTETSSRVAAVLSHVSEAIGFCVRVSDAANMLLWRLQRLFFLNGEQDLSSFLLVDMGNIKYPAYICCQTRKAFVNRKALLAYEQALEVAQAMDMAVEINDLKSVDHCLSMASMHLTVKEGNQLSAEMQDIFLDRFSSTWVFATVVTVGVSVLERERRYVEAVQYLKQLLKQSYCPGRRGYWTVRLSVDLEHLGCKEESLEVAEAGLKVSRIRHGERVALQKRVLRLGKPPRRWKKPSFANALFQSCKEVTIIGRPLNRQTGMKSRFYGYDNDQCTVEELALQYYAADSGGGWQGVHSEGGIWMTLFALLMWDVLFANVPNVFWHSFQAAPLDLNTDVFYSARAPLIEAQLERIQSGEVPQIIARTWSQWFGTVRRGLNWERFSLQEVQIMASCVGGHGLASICKLLAEDYAGLSGGMPDLFLWRVSNSQVGCASCIDGCSNAYSSLGGEAKLVEVKGPRDRLSDQQQAWISTLMEAGLDVEVCKVREEPKM